jgi:hypothetical protein
MVHVMIKTKYSTKNYVSNIVQPLSLMSCIVKLKTKLLEKTRKILNQVVLPVAYS